MPEDSVVPEIPQVENKLLIQPLFTSQKLFPKTRAFFRELFKREYLPVQGYPFKYSIKVTNIGDNVFEGALVKNVTLKSVSSVNVVHNLDKEFIINALNPGEFQKIPIDKVKTYLSGQSWVSMSLTPKGNARIVTHQVGVDNRFERYGVINAWGDSFIIGSRFETAQERTNSLILVLTVITVVEAVWGVKNTIVTILYGIKWFLEMLLSIVGLIAK